MATNRTLPALDCYVADADYNEHDADVDAEMYSWMLEAWNCLKNRIILSIVLAAYIFLTNCFGGE